MKCPKCGYLGFETVNRCRNCGYDFSMHPDRPEGELTLRDTKEPPVALSDLELAVERSAGGSKGLDLDRLIGVPDQAATIDELTIPAPARSWRPSAVDETPLLDAAEDAASDGAENLPLFGGVSRHERPRSTPEELPDVTPPRPAGPPLAVRRATPEVIRPRTRAPRTTRRDDFPLAFPADAPFTTQDAAVGESVAIESSAGEAASAIRRIIAAVIDLALLAGICTGVLYLTLRFTELTFDEIRELPLVPMTAFLLILMIGYLIAFTAAGGQTIGKMTTGIKVVGDDGGPVDVSGAALRTAGNALQMVTLGLAWLPALFAADGRSIADRIAGTRVVRA